MKLRFAIFLIIVAAALKVCSAPTERWKEWVQLGDGSIVVVEPETLNEPGGDEWAFNRAGIKPKEYRIRFAEPTGPGRRSNGDRSRNLLISGRKVL